MYYQYFLQALTPALTFTLKLLVYLNFHIAKTNKQTNKDGVRATTAQLYPGRDTFDFDQGHMTKNQPITVLILLSVSLAI